MSAQIAPVVQPDPVEETPDQKHSLFFQLPTTKEVIYDPASKRYIIKETVGGVEVSTPLFMSTTEYKDYRLKQDMKEYYNQKISAQNSDKEGSKEAQKNLLPTYYVNSNLFKTIFGGNAIETNVQGAIDVRLGVLYQNIENPQLSEANRKNITFDFDQQVTASIGAKIGERLKVTANYDTKSTFDFQNLVKIEFSPGFETANEDDIVRKIELGNVSMDVSNNLISGSQSLFGIKTELQFGKTTITSVFSEQKSETKTVTAQGGSSLNEFELQTSQYDANKYFFLAHYFRNNYNDALKNYPIINSSINVINVEVWVTNRGSNTEDVRNIVALTDMGEKGVDFYYNSETGIKESNITNMEVTETVTYPYPNPDNEANSLTTVFADTRIRNIGTVKSALPPSMVQGPDYTILENAKKLLPNEFTFHPQLGTLTLNRSLTDGDVLAVAFQYTITGNERVFQVGELTSDGIPSDENLVVKMLRSEIKEPGKRIWDLMMKNIYSLGAYQMQQEGFLLELLYKDDETGVAINSLQNAVSTYNSNGDNVTVSERTLLNLMKLDSLDQNNFVKPKGDGYFDYVEGITVNSEIGAILFPTVEPFGRDLEAKLTNPSDDLFLFNELYTNTQAVAQNDYQNRDKYYIKGYYKSDASNGISLGAFNVPRGSVTVTSNGIALTEGVDYVVDYLSGRVQIINPAVEASGAPVQVSLENNTLFNQQTKRYVGIDVEHKFSDKFQMTGTYLNVNERPLTQKVSYGSDPINNTMLGLTLNYDSEVPWLTKMVNKLPFQDTDVPSQVSVRGDFAYMLPGTPSGIDQDGEATTYIDDFEGAQIPLNVMDVNSWKLSSKPLNFPGYDFGEEVDYDDPEDPGILNSGKKRADLAWYSIDRLFYGNSSLTPPNINNDELSRAEVSRVDYSEIFPRTDLDNTQSTTLSTFDLSYFPKERGSYNYDTDNLDFDGSLATPEDRWGGITRPLTTNDFQRANVEYIQFWMQDPYENYSMNAQEGAPITPIKEGELFFNLGNISEDILKDGRKMYENGLPGADEVDNTDKSAWGDIPTNNTFLYAFNELDQDRLVQDVGLDGLGDEEERTKFPGVNPDDPSTDNYRFFRSSVYDQENASIISRYKDYNKTQGNSPTANLSPESYPTAATTVADAEDINRDQTMNSINAYYQYKVSLNANDLALGKNHIVDVKSVQRNTPDGGTKDVTWYQFRIPINSGTPINGITDFNSIRFMRMFLTKFKTPVVLRFGQLQLVRGDWRRYDKNVHGGVQVPDDDLDETELLNFTTGVVNIEENEGRVPIPYVLPPGIQREQLQGATRLQFQNEQSLSVKVNDLQAGEARTVFKNLISDLRMFKKLKMFVHAEGIGTDLQDDKMMAIMRLGSDLNDNYYQVEVPLKATLFGESTSEEVWPAENNFEVDLESLGLLKVQRYAEQGSSGANELYPLPVPGEAPMYRVRVKGNPNLANIKTMMMGVQNISTTPQSAELWFNELRVAGFDNEGGWATTVSANANFADLADVALTGSMQTIGFGGVEQRVNERSQEDVKQYGVSTNVNVGQLMPKDWGVKIPLSYSISEEFKDPKYDPKFQDVKFEDAEEINENSSSARDYTKRSSISLINVRKERVGELKKKPKPYDIENFSVSYSYNELNHRDYNVQKRLEQDVRTSANYAYNIPARPIEPFKNSESLNNKYFKIIRDINFNLLPSTIGVNSNITRTYNEQASRNLVTQGALPTLRQRNFLFDWDYNIGYNLSRNLKFNFRAANKHIYDSFEQLDDAETEDIGLYTDFFNLGRANNYNQKFDVNYQIPIDKLPYLSFVTADYNYTADFSWQAGSQSFLYQIGNSIQNANTHSLSTNMNMTKFYKEIGLKSLFTPKSKKKKKKKSSKADDGKPKFATPTAPRKIGSSKKTSTGEKVLNVAYDLITSIKSTRISYSENNGTFLPGYKQSVGFLGRSRTDGGLAPTFGFVFGDQTDIRQRALNSDWLTTRNVNLAGVEDEDYYSKNFTNTHYKKLDWSMSVKPIKDLDITINANRIETRNRNQQIDAVKDFSNRPDGNYDGSDENGSFVRRFETTQLSEISNFNMTYSMFKTAFDGDGNDTFQQFLDNRATIQQRLAAENGLDPTKYGLNSQDVLLPAFTSAYSGGSADSEKLSPFRNSPIPNWRLSYKGLMRIKWFKKNFSSFIVTHGYQSSYTIANMKNNAQYVEDDNGIPPSDINGNYFSKVIISTIALSDGFSPLIKLDMRFKNSLSFRGEVNKDRTLALSFNNNSLSDIRGTEYVFGLGYIIKDVKLKSSSGRRKAIKGDINMKADISYRQNLTTIRTVDTENTQITGGQDLFSLKISADYNLNKNLIATFYYDQTASKYAISTSFPRQSISSGISITYNLGN
ncbi:T9SS outer membrane translocon Sov/SprA [Flavicella marina]|uniref:T9SS outer membrane translocon Sov/SprA n=1 Tax=Flavicella marina TaxID=1475951 RepID=UPI00186AE138|nr:cell surface protein SprA [Flavicella marina]